MSVASVKSKPLMSDDVFRQICAMAYDCAGININDAKRDMLYRRILRRVDELGCNDFERYLSHLQQENSGEIEFFCNVISTNMTSFFRQPEQFQLLADALKDPRRPWVSGRRKKLQVWSAGCSSGEEPYSIVITVRDTAATMAGGIAPAVLATDLNSTILQAARRGIYVQDRIEGVSQDMFRKYFLKGIGSDSGNVRIKPAVQRDIDFQQLNLVKDWPQMPMFDVIFCRNVVIYFDRPTKEKLVEEFARLQEPGGLLFVGHSELLSGVGHLYQLVGSNTYERI